MLPAGVLTDRRELLNSKYEKLTAAMYPESVARRKLSWYGVRTLLRIAASGKPEKVDQYFNTSSTLVEERVVLFSAGSAEAALKLAEQEARKYCRRIRYTNIYGQSVRMRLLDATDVFSLFDGKPAPGCEVYSSTALVPQSTPDARVALERFGRPEAPGAPTRYKFIDKRILGNALEATGLDAHRIIRPAS